ncbi:hypothetical protein FACS1894208_09030 [Clostridia bacterium]|nr:hypothetical protein FACS1894208_09030 [Clostridia bacterium]
MLPKSVSDYNNYDASKISLASAKTGNISGLAIDGYAVSTTKWTALKTFADYNGSINVSAGNYLYLKDSGGNIYACYIVHTSVPISTDKTAPIVKSGGVTFAGKTVTIEFTENLIEYGYVNKNLFAVTGNTVTTVNVSSAKITLTVSDTLAAGTPSVTFNPSSSGVSDSAGTRVDGFSKAITVTTT